MKMGVIKLHLSHKKMERLTCKRYCSRICWEEGCPLLRKKVFWFPKEKAHLDNCYTTNQEEVHTLYTATGHLLNNLWPLK